MGKILVLLAAFILMSCSIKSNLDDMHDKTMEMADTTQKMSGTTGQVKATSENMFFGFRPSEAHKNRREAHACVEESKAFSDKLGCAKAYFYFFEFQAWTGQGNDNQARLDIMKKLAVSDFFQFLKKYWQPNIGDIVPMNDRLEILYSFAANLHQIYEGQDLQGQTYGFHPISMLTLIQEGLLREFEHPEANAKSFPDYEYNDSFYKEDAIPLLKMRITFLPFLAYAFLNNIAEKWQLEVFWSTFWGSNWNLDLNHLTRSNLEMYQAMLKRALMTRQFLNRIGIDYTPDLTYNKSLQIGAIYNHMHIVNDESDNTPGLKEKFADMRKFMELLHFLMGPKDQFLSYDPANYVIP